MIRLGITNRPDFLAAKRRQKLPGSPIALSLLDWSASRESDLGAGIEMFEDICFRMRTSNGIYRTTYRNRFADIDAVTNSWIGTEFGQAGRIRIDDRAVSHALTSAEWARSLFSLFQNVTYEASDILLFLVEATAPNGDIFILESNGAALQFIRPPFVIPLDKEEHRVWIVNRWLAKRAKLQLSQLGFSQQEWTTPGESLLESLGRKKTVAGWKLRTLPLIHPEALDLMKQDSRFRIQPKSVFQVENKRSEVVRTMNILNTSYFSGQQIQEAAHAIRQSLTDGGLWMIGRTLEDPLFENHSTLLRKHGNRFEVLERVGKGSEVESLLLQV